MLNNIQGMQELNEEWKKIQIEEIANITKCVGEYNIWNFIIYLMQNLKLKYMRIGMEN